jgi:hypothetical protein
MIGIGLGGFMEGYEKSQKLEADRNRQDILNQQMELQTQRANREEADWKREDDRRQAVAKINTDAQQNFDAQVAAGKEQPDNFDNFWSKYALPKLKNTYLAAGDLDSADKVQAWGDSADTKRGAKLAMGAVVKAQNGDYAGALNDAMEVGKLKGYLDHSYNITGSEQILDPDGNLQGYRLKVATADGKEVTQDLPVAQFPKMLATYLNPEAAWDSQVKAKAEAAKNQTELDQYKAKKDIDKAYGTGSDGNRGKAIEALRKRMPPRDETSAEDAPPGFDELPRPDQEKLISGELELQTGQPGLGAAPASAPAPAGSGRKVIVDTATGKPVSEAPAPQVAAPKQQPAPMSRDENLSYLVQQADQDARDGVNPERIAESLLNNGVPQDQWPESLATALSLARQNQIGLGR